MELWILVLLAVSCNLPVGIVALKKRSLTVPGGAAAAGTMGLLLFLVHPLYWILLIVFFSSSTLLTRFRRDDAVKTEAIQLAEKGGERDILQVMANGGVPVLLSLLVLYSQGTLPVSLDNPYTIALAVSFAVVNADTWATELGVTSGTEPRFILNPARKVPRGSSGGVSLLGLGASLLGSLLVGLTTFAGLVVAGTPVNLVILPISVVTMGGLLGSVIDSALGASVQAQYRCSTCDKLTEQQLHQRCCTVTVHERGLNWFGNDLVNVLSVVLSVFLLSPLIW